ncbi:MAG: D-alanine--D-alanine ligase [Candidatus Bipolaricaulia bacterium]
MDLTQARIGVLMGGLSGEREISLSSGQHVQSALASRDYQAAPIVLDDPDDLVEQLSEVDVVFNCLHGGTGEDGTLQLLFELLERPYTGSGPLACAWAMDKLAAKQEFSRIGLATPGHVERPEGQDWRAWEERVSRELGYPCVVKPVREGSSLGVHIVQNPHALLKTAQAVHAEYGELFAERFMEGEEVTAGVLRMEGTDRALPLVEMRTQTEFYDYEAKYTPGVTEFIVPAELTDDATERAQQTALEAHQALGCFGFSRVDMRVDADGTPQVLEVNTMPGMTATSDLPQAAEADGLSRDELVDRMLKSAAERPMPTASPSSFP